MATALSILARSLCSWAPVLGFVHPPEACPDGISAVVRVRGEEEWIEPCLLSIGEFADQILVLDNGATPATQKALDQLRGSLGDRLHIEACPELDLVRVSNLGLAKARHRWVIRWDADFVAHTDGPGDIRNLRRFLLALDPRCYYLVYVPAAEVAGDLFHQFPDRSVRLDGQVHTASHWARYVAVRQALRRSGLASADQVLREGPILRVTIESLQVPKFYAVRNWGHVAYFHINAKSARHTLMRHFWLEWLGQDDFGTFPTLEFYAKAQIRRRWGMDDLDEAARYFFTHYCRALRPFDHERCGPYPELLRPLLSQPRYRVEYHQGRIVGRADIS